MKLNLFIFEVNIFEIAQSNSRCDCAPYIDILNAVYSPPVLIIMTFPCVQTWGGLHGILTFQGGRGGVGWGDIHLQH